MPEMSHSAYTERVKDVAALFIACRETTYPDEIYIGEVKKRLAKNLKEVNKAVLQLTTHIDALIEKNKGEVRESMTHDQAVYLHDVSTGLREFAWDIFSSGTKYNLNTSPLEIVNDCCARLEKTIEMSQEQISEDEKYLASLTQTDDLSDLEIPPLHVMHMKAGDKLPEAPRLMRRDSEDDIYLNPQEYTANQALDSAWQKDYAAELRRRERRAGDSESQLMKHMSKNNQPHKKKRGLLDRWLDGVLDKNYEDQKEFAESQQRMEDFERQQGKRYNHMLKNLTPEQMASELQSQKERRVYVDSHKIGLDPMHRRMVEQQEKHDRKLGALEDLARERAEFKGRSKGSDASTDPESPHHPTKH